MKLRIKSEKWENGDIVEPSLKDMGWRDYHKVEMLDENAESSAEVGDDPYYLVRL